MKLFARGILAALGLTMSGALGQTHQALVICNHQFDQQAVPGARERADRVSEKLRGLGYQVTELENESDFRRAFESFADQTPTGGTTVVYFTGYGNRFLKKHTKKIKHEDGSETREESFLPACGIWGTRARSEPWSLDQLPKYFIERSRAHTHHFVFECPDPCPKEVKGHQSGMEFPEDPDFLHAHYHTSLPDLKAAGPQPLTTPDFPKNPKAGTEWMNKAGMIFCYCPPGSFEMGRRTKESPQNRDALPVKVSLSKGFWISKYETTVADYRKVRQRSPDTRLMAFPHGHLPLAGFKGPGARDFGPKTMMDYERKSGGIPDGWEYRLPTEAEWEYAARAGCTDRFSFGKSAGELSQFANFAEASLYAEDDSVYYADQKQADGVGARTAPVGSYRPNAWGIHDMQGNLSEFILDHYQEQLPGGKDPLVRLEKGSTIVLRGGAWCSTADSCDPSMRQYTRLSNNDGHSQWRGFRLILAPKK